MLKTAMLCAAALALTVALPAQEVKKAIPVKKPAILHPEMTPASDAGSYDKPMGTLGEGSDQVP